MEVAHEALIRHWQQLRRWLDENREALRKQREIEEDSQTWEEHDKPKEDFLWGGFKLAEAEKVIQEYAARVPLSTLAQEFVEASREQELRSYLRRPDLEGLDKMAVEHEAAVKSFLTIPRLWRFLEDESEELKVRVAASWVLRQWGKELPMLIAKIDEEGNISLRLVDWTLDKKKRFANVHSRTIRWGKRVRDRTLFPAF